MSGKHMLQVLEEQAADIRALREEAAAIIASAAKERFEACRTDDGPFACGEYCRDDPAGCKARHARMCEVVVKLRAVP